MQTHLSTYRGLGASVYVIAGQRPEKIEAYRRTHGLMIPMLTDPDRAVIKRYGVYHHFGLTAFNIARPATFIIDREQILRFIHIGQTQRDRPEHTTLVAALQKLPLPQRP